MSQSSAPSDKAALTAAIKSRALASGFDFVGVAPASPSQHDRLYRAWVDAGFMGEMGYLAREDAIEKRANPDRLVPGVRSAVVVAKRYSPAEQPRDEQIPPERANFARYARNDDYHDLLKDRLIELQSWISDQLIPVEGRAYVDTGPVLERELARRAGLGWFGRNTMLIIPRNGSYYFLGAVLLNVELDYDAPFADDLCGSCHRCIEQCPTGALLGREESGAPVMDARRCISYLTIEQRGPIPRELRPAIGNRVYGCDICQEVCPHNNPRFVQITDEPAFLPRQGVHGAELIELMAMDQAEFSRRFKASPVKRAKRRGLLRNVAVALGNWGSDRATGALVEAMADDEPLIRGHAAWALGRIGSAEAIEALQRLVGSDPDPWVREEIAAALDACRPSD